MRPNPTTMAAALRSMPRVRKLMAHAEAKVTTNMQKVAAPAPRRVALLASSLREEVAFHAGDLDSARRYSVNSIQKWGTSQAHMHDIAMETIIFFKLLSAGRLFHRRLWTVKLDLTTERDVSNSTISVQELLL